MKLLLLTISVTFSSLAFADDFACELTDSKGATNIGYATNAKKNWAQAELDNFVCTGMTSSNMIKVFLYPYGESAGNSIKAEGGVHRSVTAEIPNLELSCTCSLR